jgi:osmoprotectant transport system substrate-binding protein
MTAHARRSGRLATVTLRLLAVCVAVALCASCVPDAREAGGEVVVGVGSTPEQRVLAALTVLALERSGIPVRSAEESADLDDLRRAAESGALDLFWDYTGSALALELLPGRLLPADPEESFERVARADEQRNDFVWLGPTEANATLAFFVRPTAVPEGEQRTLTWLSRELSTGRPLCADPDFLERESGLEQLAEEYSITFDALQTVPASEDAAVDRVVSGACFAGLATATSGAAEAAGLVPVADDLGVFPAFIVAPVLRASALEAAPQIRTALTPLLGLTTDELRRLNGLIEEGAEPRAVAEETLGGLPAEGI